MADPRNERYQAYLDAIRRKVCGVCLDRRDDGTCHLAGGRTCAIEDHLPRVVEAILRTDSDHMDAYVEAIKAEVCGECQHSASAESCSYRDRGECALWTYLPLVVDAIEELRNAAGLATRPRSA